MKDWLRRLNSGEVLGLATGGTSLLLAIDTFLSRNLIEGGFAVALAVVAVWFSKSLKEKKKFEVDPVSNANA